MVPTGLLKAASPQTFSMFKKKKVLGKSTIEQGVLANAHIFGY